MDKTAAGVLAGKHPPKKKKIGNTLEYYEATPFFISMDITEEVVALVVRKRLGSVGPGGTDSEALQGGYKNSGTTAEKYVLVLNILWDGWPIKNHIDSWPPNSIV